MERFTGRGSDGGGLHSRARRRSLFRTLTSTKGKRLFFLCFSETSLGPQNSSTGPSKGCAALTSRVARAQPCEDQLNWAAKALCKTARESFVDRVGRIKVLDQSAKFPDACGPGALFPPREIEPRPSLSSSKGQNVEACGQYRLFLVRPAPVVLDPSSALNRVPHAAFSRSSTSSTRGPLTGSPTTLRATEFATRISSTWPRHAEPCDRPSPQPCGRRS